MWLTNKINLYIQPKIRVKCQAHNLKVVGSNPTPATKYLIKSMTYTTSRTSVFGVFLRLKHTIELKVANKVANARQVYSMFISFYTCIIVIYTYNKGIVSFYYG